jgi:hypothetical protein
MFKFIKKLFKKETKVTVDIPETKDPIWECDENMVALLKDLDETAVLLQDRMDERRGKLNEEIEALHKTTEQSEILLQRGLEIQGELDNMLKRLGIVHRFRDTKTGEIYEVEPGDNEKFNEMMCNKDMQMLFG